MHEGAEFIRPFLVYDFAASFVSEIELLGFKNLSAENEIRLKELLKDSIVINLSEEIKFQTIKLKQKYTIKLPDAIIAATAIFNKVPLVTADKGYNKITELELILLEV